MHSDGPTLLRLLWADDGATQNAILFVIAVALVSLLFVYAPLIVRLVRIALLDRAVRSTALSDEIPRDSRQESVAKLFGHSLLAWHWTQFAARWSGARMQEQPVRAPVRLVEVLDEQPLLPTGIRRSLLPALPGIFLTAGVLGTFIGLTQAVTAGGTSPGAGDQAQVFGAVAGQLGLALRTALWGLILALTATVVTRILEGGFDYYTESLDRSVAHAFTSVSSGELASLAAMAQRQSVEQLGNELTRFTNDLTERLDRGLQRIERSTSSAANLVSEEQRGVLQSVVRELSLQVQRGVEQHLGSLHEMLDRSIDHQGSVTGALSDTFKQLAHDAQSHARVTQSLQQAGASVESAATAMNVTAHEFKPLLDGLRETSNAMQQTAGVMGATQDVVSRSAEGVRSSIEHASAAMSEQRDFIESGLGEIRGTLEAMSTGLGENLERALRSVDDALDHTVGRLRETITSSNETIERMTGPVRAAEGTTRELHTALDRVRGEIVGLAEWLGTSMKPLNQTLGLLEDRTSDITRALVDFGDRSRSVDKTIQSLRGEIHDHGRKFSQSTTELGRHLRDTTDALHAVEGSKGAKTPRRESRAAAIPSARRAPSVSQRSEDDDATVRPAIPAPVVATAPPSWSRNLSEPEEPAPAPREPEEAAPSSAPSFGSGSPTPASSSLDESESKTGSISTPAPGLGRVLGPDPYARGGSAPSEPEVRHPAEALAPGKAGGFNGSDDLTLSGLLNPKKGGANTGNGTAASEAGDEEADSSANADAAQEEDDSHDETGRPRTWRFLGRD